MLLLVFVIDSVRSRERESVTEALTDISSVADFDVEGVREKLHEFDTDRDDCMEVLSVGDGENESDRDRVTERSSDRDAERLEVSSGLGLGDCICVNVGDDDLVSCSEMLAVSFMVIDMVSSYDRVTLAVPEVVSSDVKVASVKVAVDVGECVRSRVRVWVSVSVVSRVGVRVFDLESSVDAVPVCVFSFEMDLRVTVMVTDIVSVEDLDFERCHDGDGVIIRVGVTKSVIV